MQISSGRKVQIELISVFSVALAVVIVFLFGGFFLIASMKDAHSSEDPNAGRYYVGLGVVIEKQESGIDVGAIKVLRVFPGSPAEKSDLVPGDLIVGIDGAPAKDISTRKFMYAAKYGVLGSSMMITVLREAGHGVVRITVPVKRGLVDESAHILRDDIIESMCGKKSEQLRLQAKVSEDPITGEFTYWHRITNDSDEQVFIQSELLDRLASESWNGLQIFHFKPYESREFVLKSKDWPTKRGYSLNQLFVATNDISERISEWGFSGHSLWRDYVLGRRCGLTGFLPERSTKKQGN